MKESPKSLFPFYEETSLKDREVRRTYLFPGGEKVVIEGPQFLIVSDNGHRIQDAAGISHYIPYGWIHLFWENKGDRSFVCKES